jgi:hypothetical protein
VRPAAPAAAEVKARRSQLSAISLTPRIRVAPFTTEGTSGNWTVTWPIGNDHDVVIRLLTAQHPHSQFRTPETMLDQEIGAGAETAIRLPVHFVELPGFIVENPFLILVVRQVTDWRFLARVRVTAGRRGEPIAGGTVIVTSQRVRTP